MRTPKRIIALSSTLAAVVTSLTSVASAPNANRVAAPRTANDVALAMLKNIQENGFNSDPRINAGLGGLWINWRAGTKPLLVNFNGSGSPDKIDPPRHDPFTDFRYLHNLLSWKHQHPHDKQFDAETKKFMTLVKSEFAGTHDQRGWLYDELMDMWRLSKDEFFRDTSRSLAEYYATKEIHPDIGAIYKTRTDNPNGYYRVDNALEVGCALVMAGVEFKRPDWRAKGERLVNFVYAHAYLSDAHLFLNLMDEVRQPDGSANPNEKIYREPFRNYVVDGGIVRFGNIGQEALSLLHTYVVTTNRLYLERAEDLLRPLTSEINELGLWDTKNGGYFNGVQFDGPDFLHPGKPKLLDSKKESGRQFHMLQAFHVANQVTGGKYRSMEGAMLRVLLDKAYYEPGRGIVYEMAPDWSLLKAKSGGFADWVTSEAMGCALLAMFSLNEEESW